MRSLWLHYAGKQSTADQTCLPQPPRNVHQSSCLLRRSRLLQCRRKQAFIALRFLCSLS